MYIKHCYISVGGGTAGSVLANRLSEDPDIRVLVLEAGGEESGFPNVDIPLLSTFLRYKEYDWNYYTEPQAQAFLGFKNKVYVTYHSYFIEEYFNKTT